MFKMANLLNKDPFTYEEERKSFLQDLHRFHQNRGTPYERIPHIAGREVDLYHLYRRVIGLGGWQKVNNEDRWQDIQSEFKVPRHCTNGVQALKYIYFRFLNTYEKVHFLGEDPNRPRVEEDDHPARKKACTPIYGYPLTYNYTQHHVSDAVRQAHGLSSDLLQVGDYDKLEKALISGLPNEVDFVFNVCTLLSNEGRHCLKLEKSQHIIPLLLAHVGIFDEEDFTCFEELYLNGWIQYSKRDFLRFWIECVKNQSARNLITFGGMQYSRASLCGDEVLHLGRDAGIYDKEGQRVTQLAVLLRNLSFEEENQKVLATDPLVFKFLLLCVHSSYGSLKQLALDTLGNLATQMVLAPAEDSSTKLLLGLVTDGLHSNDKFIIVRALEILGKLCLIEQNELILSENLDDKTYNRLCQLLTVYDIQMIVHTLETMYQLSELGDETTTRIAAVRSAVDLLISLLTVEAQSYGPNSLIGIKVVECVQAQPAVPSTECVSENDNRPPATMVMQPPGSSVSAKHLSVRSPSVSCTVNSDSPSDIESTTLNWLRATYEYKKGVKVTQVDLFSDYLQFCRKFGIADVLPSADFIQLVKVVFSQSEMADVKKANGDKEACFANISKRSVPKQFSISHSGVGSPQSVSAIPLQPTSTSGGSFGNNKTQEVSRPSKPSTKSSKTLSSVITSAVPIVLNVGVKPTTSTTGNVPNLPLLKPKTVLQQHLQTPPGQQKIAPKPAEVSIHHYHPQQQQFVQLNISDSTNPNLIKSLLAKKLNQNMVVRQTQPFSSPNNLVPATTSPLLILTDQITLASQSIADVGQPQVASFGCPQVAMNYEFGQHNSNQSTDSGLSRNSVSVQSTAQLEYPQSVNAVQQMSLNILQTISTSVNNSSPLTKSTSPKSVKKKKAENSRKETCSPCPTSPTTSVKSPRLSSESHPSTTSESRPASPRSASPRSQPFELEVCGRVERAKDIVQTGAETLIERVENKCLEQLHELQKQISKPSIVSDLSTVSPLIDEEKPVTKNGINMSSGHSSPLSENVLNSSAFVSDSCATNLSDLSTPILTNSIKVHFVDKPLGKVNDQHNAKVITKSFDSCELPCDPFAYIDKKLVKCSENKSPEQNPPDKCNMTNSTSIGITDVTQENSSENFSSKDMEMDYLNDQNSFLANANSIPTGLVNGLNSPMDSPSSIDQDMPPSPISEYKENGTVFNGQEISSCKGDAGNSVSKRFTKEKLSKLIGKSGKLNGIAIHLGNGDYSVEENMEVDSKRDSIPKGFLESNIDQRVPLHGQPAVCSMTESNVKSQGLRSDSSAASVKSTGIVLNCDMTGNGIGIHFMSSQQSPMVLQSLTPEQKTLLLKPNLQMFKDKTEKIEISIEKVEKICDTRHIPTPDTRDGELSSDSFASSTAESISEKHSTPEALTMQTFYVDSDKPDNTVISAKGEKKVKPRKRSRSNASAGSSEPKSPAVMVPIGPEYICEWEGCKKCFENSRAVFFHISHHHVKEDTDGFCKWEGCEILQRTRWSLVTHCQDHHCSESALRAATIRRHQAAQRGSVVPAAPPANILVYPPDAAMQAIKRFSVRPPFTEFQDSREGPVTKHIRLTAGLILRNLARYSALGRSLIKKRENHLNYQAMSATESSTALANCLWEILHDH
ncbi:AT-rich interactive domain-containing protein 2-like isoform X2 [Gigantopelta aegis]|uniref:AT-rich interactive domain-containing protein 2-like isoform X2 n=1 Tax=Gigantopelta aegis TaxID=1735272 RepID=UPI001B88D4E9|nr:AT-rich interactive domain-containing protein 2-like isoform X2 [Gigantopelta aegis]